MKRDVLKLVIFLAVAPMAVTAEIIRCPDWKKLIAVHEGRAALRSADPGANFDLLVQNASTTSDKTIKDSDKTIKDSDKTIKDSDKTIKDIDHSATSVCKYKVGAGDTLSNISQTVLGSYLRWREIQKLNSATLKGGTMLGVGQVLRMPCTNAVTAKPVEITPEKPSWSAKSGEAFTVVMKRWAKAAGVTLVIKTKDEWMIAVPVKITGTFRQAVEELVEGLSNTGMAPPVRIYRNNIMKLG